MLASCCMVTVPGRCVSSCASISRAPPGSATSSPPTKTRAATRSPCSESRLPETPSRVEFMTKKSLHIETNVVHGTARAGHFEGAQITPIVRSTVFEAGDQIDPQNIRYGRLSTLANQLEAAEVLARVEGAEAGLVTSSGMAAITTTLIA